MGKSTACNIYPYISNRLVNLRYRVGRCGDYLSGWGDRTCYRTAPSPSESNLLAWYDGMRSQRHHFLDLLQQWSWFHGRCKGTAGHAMLERRSNMDHRETFQDT